jgi:hypothetical protein
MFCEQNYYNFVKWKNYPNKSCTSWKVMKLRNWIFLFELIYCFKIWFHFDKDHFSRRQGKRLTAKRFFIENSSRQNIVLSSATKSSRQKVFAGSILVGYREKVILPRACLFGSQQNAWLPATMGFAVVSAVLRVTVSSCAPETTETQNGDGAHGPRRGQRTRQPNSRTTGSEWA